MMPSASNMKVESYETCEIVQMCKLFKATLVLKQPRKCLIDKMRINITKNFCIAKTGVAHLVAIQNPGSKKTVITMSKHSTITHHSEMQWASSITASDIDTASSNTDKKSAFKNLSGETKSTWCKKHRYFNSLAPLFHNCIY